MARPRYPKSEGPLPPPLPPAERTVGQVVAESLRFYGANFWRCLGLGLPIAVLNLLAIELSGGVELLVVGLTGAVFLSATFVAANALVYGVRPAAGTAAGALLAGLLVFLPLELLVKLYILPGVAWFALFGLVVPVTLVEHLPFRAAVSRAVALARADYIHVLGSLATLFIVLFLTQTSLYAGLANVGDQAASAASFLAGLVVSPILFLGAALLYEDQTARLDRPAKARVAS